MVLGPALNTLEESAHAFFWLIVCQCHRSFVVAAVISSDGPCC